MTVTSLESVPQGRMLARPPLWLALAVGAVVLVMAMGSSLLVDTDTLWQVKVGQWILANRAVPHVDVYSLTKTGEPWISTSWLAQVLFALGYALAGWAGVVLPAALALGATVALLIRSLTRRLPTAYACFATGLVFALSSPHFFARPHLLAMPVMVAWVDGLVTASDRGERPSFWLLPLLALWTNLHGSFVFGLALIGPFALDAVWNAEAGQRKPLVLRWALFGIAALFACGLTPYGWGALLASHRILDLGELLPLIAEWAPFNFGSFTLFEACVLTLIGLALYAGVKLTPPRILLALGLLHMALGHVRNVEVFALLLPLVLMTPLADRFAAALGQPRQAPQRSWSGSAVMLAVAALAIGGVVSAHPIRPPLEQKAADVAAVLRTVGAKRVFNDQSFGGCMIWSGLRPFIDGRAELYGETYGMDYFKAVSLQEPGVLFRLLDSYDIDTTVLYPATPAVRVLDRLEGWQRVYSSDFVVIHARTARGEGEPSRPPLQPPSAG